MFNAVALESTCYNIVFNSKVLFNISICVVQITTVLCNLGGVMVSRALELFLGLPLVETKEKVHVCVI